MAFVSTEYDPRSRLAGQSVSTTKSPSRSFTHLISQSVNQSVDHSVNQSPKWHKNKCLDFSHGTPLFRWLYNGEERGDAV